jgi:hypothetical protein
VGVGIACTAPERVSRPRSFVGPGGLAYAFSASILVGVGHIVTKSVRVLPACIPVGGMRLRFAVELRALLESPTVGVGIATAVRRLSPPVRFSERPGPPVPST